MFFLHIKKEKKRNARADQAITLKSINAKAAETVKKKKRKQEVDMVSLQPAYLCVYMYSMSV